MTYPKKSLLTFIITSSFASFFILNYAFNLNFLPTGVLNKSFPSPDKTYDIKTYHYNSFFYDFAKADLVHNEKNYRKTIYFNRKDYSPYVEWLDNEKVMIGREIIDIPKGQTYDFRKRVGSNPNLPKQY
jgi:hypothetical protein